MLLNDRIITIDGPSGSGKGTVAQIISEKLSLHYLDSGALYRVLGFVAAREKVELNDGHGLVSLARDLELRFEGEKIFLGNSLISDEIRTETAGNLASKIAAIGAVREALLEWQRNCVREPGLVADGRDMGTVVFPDAKYKIFLTASVESRAQRRFKQLRDKGFSVNIRRLLQEIAERDERDVNRKTSPLKPAADAICLDSTQLGIDQVVSQVLNIIDVESFA